MSKSSKKYWRHVTFVVMGHSPNYNRVGGDGPPTRYVRLWVAHAPGMPVTFSPPPTSKETASWLSRHASRHVRDARAVMRVGMAHSRWRGKPSRHSRRMRNPQFYVSGKSPMVVSQYQDNNTSTWITIIKMTQCHDSLIFTMGITTIEKMACILKRGSGWWALWGSVWAVGSISEGLPNNIFI